LSGEFPHFPQFPLTILRVESVGWRKIIIGISGISAGRIGSACNVEGSPWIVTGRWFGYDPPDIKM